jgi:hypothetical protein
MSPRVSFADDGATDPATSPVSIHGWLTPAALGVRRSPVKSARYAMHTRPSAGAAGVSPPWGTIRTRCCESRAMFGDWRTHNQERRASARRGVRYERVAARVEHCSAIGEHTSRSGGRQPAVCSVRRTMSAVSRRSLASAFPNPRLAHASRSWSQTRMLVPVCVSYRRARYSSHGWLTPAAPGRRRGCLYRCAFRTGERATHPTAGLRQPLLIAPRPFGAEYDIWDVQTHVHKSGGRQPAVGYDTNALLRELSTVRQSANTKPGAAGVSPPCARSVERCLRFVADHLQVRSPTHGWLTPAALGRKCGCRCRCAFHTRGYATHRTAGLRQPLLLRDADSVKSARYAMHTRTSARAAGVSPPWCAIRTRCCES